jgi:hypothetical protein
LVLIDWQFVAALPPAVDLGWMLQSCLPIADPKEGVIDRYHAQLSNRLGGRLDEGTWEPQLRVALLGQTLRVIAFMLWAAYHQEHNPMLRDLWRAELPWWWCEQAGAGSGRGRRCGLRHQCRVPTRAGAARGKLRRWGGRSRIGAVGQLDMCRNGLSTECGIKQQDGYAREQYRLDPQFAIRISPALGDLGVLVEPTSVVAKACLHSMHVLRRAEVPVRSALVTGAGPIGLLAALVITQAGINTYVVDIVESGPKPDLVRICPGPADLAGRGDRMHGYR